MNARNRIALAPFPFDDLTTKKGIPALCLSNELSSSNQIITAFISSKATLVLNSIDVLISAVTNYFVQIGLKLESVIMLHKIVTVSSSITIKEIGFLPNSYQPIINNNLKLIF